MGPQCWAVFPRSSQSRCLMSEKPLMESPVTLDRQGWGGTSSQYFILSKCSLTYQTKCFYTPCPREVSRNELTSLFFI